MKIVVVTTLYNSAPYLEEFYKRTYDTLQNLTDDYEFIFVNDGSPDDALQIALQIYEQDACVNVIDLSRNFGHHKAMMTGLQHANGDYIFLIDCDLEESPEWLPLFFEKMHVTKADVVYGIQKQRQDSFFNRSFGMIFYKLFNTLSDFPIPENLLTVRLMTQNYVNQLVQYQEQDFIIASLWAMVGFEQEGLVVDKKYKGRSNYNFAKKFAYILRSISTISNRPLIYISYLGMFMMLMSGFYISYVLFRWVSFGVGVDGWLSVILSIWFLGGLNVFILGLISIYLSVVFAETKARPYTVIRKKYLSRNEKTKN